jgi:hypothetical protein
MRERLNPVAHNLLRRAAHRVGLDVVRANYYSPVVDARELPAESWDSPAPMPGLRLDLDAQLKMIDQRLSPFIAEFRPPVEQQAGFWLDNPWYGPMDAHLLYALLRASPPRRVLELGSGYSTLVIEQALDANPGARAPHRVVDPNPSPLLTGLRAVDVTREPAARISASRFDELESGDVLFVDTTHVIRPGGEVVRLVLEVLPALAPGVVVHFHDIYRPFAYPRVFYDHFNLHWQEQYLLQAFLAYNDNFTVVCANHALWRLRRARVTAIFPGLREGREPSGFWFVSSPRPGAAPAPAGG